MLNYLGATNFKYVEDMEIAAGADQVINDADLSNERRQRNMSIYFILGSFGERKCIAHFAECQGPFWL